MALELNKKKYLVLCVMLILSNHQINGAIGAGSKKGSKTDEPQAPESGPKAETLEIGSKSPGSQISNSGPKTPDVLKSGSQISNSGPKTPDVLKGGSQISNNGPKTPDVLKSGPQISNSGPRTPDVLKSGSKTTDPGSKAEAPEIGSKAEPPSKASIYQFSSSGPRIPDAMSPGGSIAMSPDGAPAPGPQITNTLIETLTKSAVTAAADGSHEMIKIPVNGTKPGQPQVPCYFIFGDSLVDAGNNNILQTLARADYEPYGMDFKARPGPTGRFSNGKTTVDVIAELLGFDHYIPPSELTNGTDILQGLNFASAAAGIREETAQHLGDRITMREQVDNFRAKKCEMAKLLGGEKNTTDYLGKCLFSVGLGSNDYLNNYFIPNLYPTSKLLTPEQYADDLVKQYTKHLMDIYDLGARKFVLNGVSQVGCSPNSLAQHSADGTCVKKINDANEMFNAKLKTLVDTLNKDRPDGKFTYVNAYGFFQELKDKAATYGFKDTSDGCCGIGKNNGLITCLPGFTTCPNRNEYLFWDAYHPTEATNTIGAKRSYKKELPTDAYPYDIHTLVTLK